jgi:hypothetical protein
VGFVDVGSAPHALTETPVSGLGARKVMINQTAPA